MNCSSQPGYRAEARKGIDSPRLQSSLHGLQERFGKGAMEFWATMDDPEMRTRVKEARMSNFEHLDILLAELADKINGRGGHVYFAETAADAVHYTLEVARKNNVRRVVKGKSMTSMEVDVDPALAAEGIEVVETDLGEYIVQLAGDKPSHIIAPCIHMDRNQIGELFTEKLGIEYSDDPPTLTMAARRALREKLLRADMGLTGCNLACSETGHISLVSNEGNIRMTTTMPQVHVALMGMERISATFHEHRQTLQLLTRGAALQKLSTYVSFLGGPASSDDPDGPEEFHLVIIDNGRSKILADPEFREVLACIRCGACLNICPVYGRIGGHAYNSPYPGPIGAVLTPLLDGVNKHADLCKGETLCGACKDVCPVHNDLPRMLAALRHKLAYGSDRWETRQHNPTEAYGYRLWRMLVSNSYLYRICIKAGRLLQRPFVKGNRVTGRMGKLAAGWTEGRDLPPIARRTFDERWAKRYGSSNSRSIQEEIK
jgi:L-lactate dehydrogenase complex protein LldF